MVERYPHTLVLNWSSDGSYDSDGDYSPGDSQELSIDGRAEANGKGELIKLEDGSQIMYAWTFFCQPSETEPPFGAKATLTHNTGTWIGTVKRAAINQRGMQIWV